VSPPSTNAGSPPTIVEGDPTDMAVENRQTLAVLAVRLLTRSLRQIPYVARPRAKLFHVQEPEMTEYFTHFSCALDVGTPDNAAHALDLYNQF
jgi:hypothetical protein